jgi:hypothetical protein
VKGIWGIDSGQVRAMVRAILEQGREGKVRVLRDAVEMVFSVGKGRGHSGHIEGLLIGSV